MKDQDKLNFVEKEIKSNLYEFKQVNIGDVFINNETDSKWVDAEIIQLNHVFKYLIKEGYPLSLDDCELTINIGYRFFISYSKWNLIDQEDRLIDFLYDLIIDGIH